MTTTTKLSQRDLGWIAGILEGEGSFHKQNNRIIVKVKMTDRDILYRLRELTRVGNVHGPHSNGPHKVSYSWTVGVQKDASALMMTMYPLMGERRQEKIQELLIGWRLYKPVPLGGQRLYPAHLSWSERKEWSEMVNPQ